jgi:hypothetical protein
MIRHGDAILVCTKGTDMSDLAALECAKTFVLATSAGCIQLHCLVAGGNERERSLQALDVI